MNSNGTKGNGSEDGDRRFNATDNDDHSDLNSGFSVKFDVLPITLAVLIIAFNGLVLLLVVRRKQLRNAANYMLCSLALSDTLTGLVCVPLVIACNILREDMVCILSENFLRFTSISTVLHLLAITADRYLAIVHSLRYYILVTPRRGFASMAIIWSVSVIVAFVQLIWHNPSTSDVNKDPSQKIKDIEVTYDIVNLVVFFGFPLCFMIFVNSKIFYEVVRQSNIMRQNNAPGMEDSKRRQRREWKAALIFVIMFIVYIVCWLPYFLWRLQQNIGDSFFELGMITEYVFIYLRFLSSLLNPCIYVLGKNDFRKALKKNRPRSNSISKASVTKYSFLKTTTL
ncbi:octopamine receptor beta-2R-like [Actinia tenebrosa]|uniref:Octopamine receptor beta-2R-like n=1 Tax=Actinia tenebrosa TaxID=6105 RepID=A0A6P8H878_ACTTE|nr:octopamine receptor beta-2R-like [Actinia tenebrosa]XP_031548937.1 octopamine receptor beta-2R-like [Actinia tenebrosa]XP_031548938.1 octopamine receptor beta-2R-like [Actinia tenebrosa]XP_031548939.1 octopamine receptor beta-2R-like [Actinia tenebrosa]XP_031548940.1 octopamine receptor beta-2R-like [Actinia tenebrosa]XP_031548941.1 octopamine receptor beta-2R-like [Actinia tenebrosa]XP_031548942.1 octopamine receptor beta-2R-like [Actinia tenebrosa]XP_031548943.1 octopamine receptor beta